MLKDVGKGRAAKIGRGSRYLKSEVDGEKGQREARGWKQFTVKGVIER